MIDTDKERKQAFVEGLSKLTQETGITIDGYDGGIYLDPIEPELSAFIYYELLDTGTFYGDTQVSQHDNFRETVERWISRTSRPHQLIEVRLENNKVLYRDLSIPNAPTYTIAATAVLEELRRAEELEKA